MALKKTVVIGFFDLWVEFDEDEGEMVYGGGEGRPWTE